MTFTVPSTSTNSGNISGTTGLSITKPTGLQDDDILYAILSKHDEIGTAFASTGWTALVTQSSTVGADMLSTVLRKVITDASSEAASYTFTFGHSNSYQMAGTIATVRGGDTTTPEDATTAYLYSQNDDTPDSPTITTATDGALVLPICCLNNLQGGDLITFGAPTSYTLAAYVGTHETAQNGIAYAVKASAGATGGINWMNTADTNQSEYHVYTVAVKPAGGGPAGLSIPVAMRHYRNLRS